MNFTLNQISMLALTLMVGIVIDDAIIVLENIYRYMEEKGMPPMQAAIEGTKEIGLAVMATTISLVVIFLPIAFMNGYAKRYINPFGWTMAFAIPVSMLVSFTLTPMLSSRFLKLADGAADRKTKEGGFFHWLDVWYTRQVNWALDRSNLIIGISVVAALSIVPLDYMVGREFVPNEDMGEWTIHMDAPEGTSLAGTTEVAFKLLKKLGGIEGVAQIEPSIGVSGPGSQTHIHFLCQALPMGERRNTQATIIAEMRRARPYGFMIASTMAAFGGVSYATNSVSHSVGVSNTVKGWSYTPSCDQYGKQGKPIYGPSGGDKKGGNKSGPSGYFGGFRW